MANTKIKTSDIVDNRCPDDLSTQELDRAVADILGIKVGICLGGYLATEESIKFTPWSAKHYSPSTDWSQGGPIIDSSGVLLRAAIVSFVKDHRAKYKGHKNAFFPFDAVKSAKANRNNI